MTVGEMINVFLLTLESINPELVNSKSRPKTIEIVNLLNKAQLNYVRQKYLEYGGTKMNNEALNKFIVEFKALVNATTVAVGAAVPTYYGNYFETPSGFLYYLRADVEVRRSAYPVHLAAEVYPCVLKEFGDFNEIASTYLNKKIISHPYVFHIKNSLWVMTDSFTTLGSLYLIYMATPAKLTENTPQTGETNTCELNEFVHLDLVNMAVKEYLSSKVNQTKE